MLHSYNAMLKGSRSGGRSQPADAPCSDPGSWAGCCRGGPRRLVDSNILTASPMLRAWPSDLHTVNQRRRYSYRPSSAYPPISKKKPTSETWFNFISKPRYISPHKRAVRTNGIRGLTFTSTLHHRCSPTGVANAAKARAVPTLRGVAGPLLVLRAFSNARPISIQRFGLRMRGAPDSRETANLCWDMEACPSNRAGLGPCLGYGNPFHNWSITMGAKQPAVARQEAVQRACAQAVADVDGKVAVVLTPRAGRRINEVYRATGTPRWPASAGHRD